MVSNFSVGINFLHTSRHEISDVHHVTWKELLAVDWKGLRKKADVDPAYRAVVCGATVSPAWFQHCNTFPTSCVLGVVKLGTWQSHCLGMSILSLE